MPGARRFEVGNYNFIDATAIEPGLSIIKKMSTASREQHVIRIAERMIRGAPNNRSACFFAQAGDPSRTPGRRRRRDQRDSTDNPAIQSLYNVLSDDGIGLTIRWGLI